MTPREIRDEFRELRKEIGSCAYLCAELSMTGTSALEARVWPNGITKGGSFHAKADDWETLLANLRAEWEDHRAEVYDVMVREMAMEIIRITDRDGECTDSVLRGGNYTSEDIERYGDAACAKADEMAGKGPFEIVRIRGANAA